MFWRLFACAALMGTTAFAGWPRYLSGDGKGPSTDSPPAHPLAYFQVDPCLRPRTDALVLAIECTWQGKPAPTPEELKRWTSTRIDLVEVGKIGNWTIYDLWYWRDGPSYGPAYPNFDLRSVLVKTAADQYREINVQVRNGGVFPPSEIINLDGEPILIAKFHDGGNDSNIYETRYMFNASGLAAPDFSAVGEAVAKLKPPNMSGVIAKDDYPSMTFTLELYKNDTTLPRVDVKERGRITVTYRFVDGRAVVTSSKYEPYTLE
jgi:hypothetical protein